MNKKAISIAYILLLTVTFNSPGENVQYEMQAVQDMVFFWAVVQGMPAHPHVLITNRLTFIFDEIGLKGIGVGWDFSEVFNIMIRQNFDLDRMFPLPLNREMAEFFVIKQVSMVS